MSDLMKNIWNEDFFIPEIPDSLYDKENLYYYSYDFENGKTFRSNKMKYVYFGTAEVWAVAQRIIPLKENPWYLFFNAGTNDLRIFRYQDHNEGWQRIAVTDIPHERMYDLLWKIFTFSEYIIVKNEKI